MREIMNAILFCSILQSPAHAETFSCPAPTRQVDDEIKGDISGKAKTLLKFGEVEFTGKVDASVINLFEKYPNADRIALAQTLQSMTCQVLRNSASLSDEQKLDRILALAKALETYLK